MQHNKIMLRERSQVKKDTYGNFVMSNSRKCKLIYSDRKLSGMLRAGRDHNRAEGILGVRGIVLVSWAAIITTNWRQ